jgi:hypothetical protein
MRHFVPRRVREQSEREQSLKEVLLLAIDDATELRQMTSELTKMVLNAVRLAGQERARGELAERGMNEAVDAICAAVARHRAGDDAGAFLALEIWLERASR